MVKGRHKSAQTLLEASVDMCGRAQLGLYHRTEQHQVDVSELRDLQDIIGQQGKRALARKCAVGNHNFIFSRLRNGKDHVGGPVWCRICYLT
ncbi:hypothetical protein OH492_01155 [Vibrio chagasii]|nr:hypothetical protein [Vibrio chagasii]